MICGPVERLFRKSLIMIVYIKIIFIPCLYSSKNVFHHKGLIKILETSQYGIKRLNFDSMNEASAAGSYCPKNWVFAGSLVGQSFQY